MSPKNICKLRRPSQRKQYLTNTLPYEYLCIHHHRRLLYMSHLFKRDKLLGDACNLKQTDILLCLLVCKFIFPLFFVWTATPASASICRCYSSFLSTPPSNLAHLNRLTMALINTLPPPCLHLWPQHKRPLLLCLQWPCICFVCPYTHPPFNPH